MSFDIFQKEEKVIAAGKALLTDENLCDADLAEAYATLLKDYEKLFKSSKRLIRLSDRNESELNKVAKSLDNKNAMLEGLSSKLSKYLSPQIYNSIFTGEQNVALETSRKKLTIFFSDIKNFTATTDDMEPEDITYLINDYLTEMSAIALEYGATIDKFIGDAMVMFFGDPTTKGVQEDALACVQMSIAMQRHMVGLRAKWSEMGHARPFQMRVGINTGYCNVGNFGSEERMDYTIIGGEVNLTARLEDVADPDGITMSYETYSLVKEFVDAEKGEAINVKGIHRTINPYNLIGIYKNADATNRYFRAENEGMKLFLDLDKLDEVSRPEAIRSLEDFAQRLKDQETG
jgi:adenylate cyclase